MQNSADDREERTFPADAAGILNTDALFSDGTKTFVCPMEPEIGEEVTIRFRTAAANAEAVYLCPVNREKLPMTPERSEGVFDYFFAVARDCRAGDAYVRALFVYRRRTRSRG